MEDCAGLEILLSRLNARVRTSIVALEKSGRYSLKPGRVQLMIFDDHYGKVGGINTKDRHCYVLKTFAERHFAPELLISLGFRLVQRSNGTLFWRKYGADDLEAFEVLLLSERLAKAA